MRVVCVRGAGLASLERLPELTSLSLINPEFTDKGARALAAACPKLHTLHITALKLSQFEAMAEFRALRDLQLLNASGVTATSWNYFMTHNDGLTYAGVYLGWPADGEVVRTAEGVGVLTYAYSWMCVFGGSACV